MSAYRIALAAAAVVFLICFPQTARSEMAFRGVGGTTCGQFAEYYRTDPADAETLFYSWAQGFMSGMNVNFLFPEGESTDLGDSRYGIDTQKGHLRLYCDQHPLAFYSQAVFNLWDTMRAQQELPKWPPGDRN